MIRPDGLEFAPPGPGAIIELTVFGMAETVFGVCVFLGIVMGIVAFGTDVVVTDGEIRGVDTTAFEDFFGIVPIIGVGVFGFRDFCETAFCRAAFGVLAFGADAFVVGAFGTVIFGAEGFDAVEFCAETFGAIALCIAAFGVLPLGVDTFGVETFGGLTSDTLGKVIVFTLRGLGVDLGVVEPFCAGVGATGYGTVGVIDGGREIGPRDETGVDLNEEGVGVGDSSDALKNPAPGLEFRLTLRQLLENHL